MKKFAVIVSGWHFPISFYKQINKQKIPDGWEVDYFCVSQRDPSIAKEEKQEHELMHKEVQEATIPKVEDLPNLNSLFGKD